MSEESTAEERRFERAMLELALNQAGVRINRVGYRSRLAALEDEVEESARSLIGVSESGLVSTIVCSASASSSVGAVYDQITMSLSIGTPTLDLMLERDAAAATLGAVMLGMHAQVDAAMHTISSLPEGEHTESTILALEEMYEAMPWCEHTSQVMLSVVDGQAMYARPLNRVAQTLGAKVNWPPEAMQEKR